MQRIFRWAFLFLFPLSIWAQDHLVFAVDIIRHGDRAPVADVKYPPYIWPEGPGQLTAEGMHQEYQNGVNFRGFYVNETHLLPTNYQAGSLYVRSSDFDRTLMSAEAVLTGLYPPGTGPNLPDTKNPALPDALQPIPIHTVPKDSDSLFFPQQPMPLFKRYVFSSPDWQQKNAELAPNYARWSEASGMKIKTLYNIIGLGDALYIRQVHNVPLPQGLSKQDVQTIISAYQWAIARLFSPPEVSDPLAHNLLMQIDQYFQDASLQKTALKYVLFSAHDVTLLSTLSALGAPLSVQVPYASDLRLELLENDTQQYFVKVTYNGKPVNLPNCQNSDTCTLSEFVAIDR